MKNSQKTDAEQTQKNKFPHGNKLGKQFQPGVSGNFNGRPRLTKITESLREQVAREHPEMPEKTIADVVAQTLVTMALSGDLAAIRELLDRTEGKPKQAIDLDVSVQDWRSIASGAGLTEEEFIDESKLYVAELEASLLRE